MKKKLISVFALVLAMLMLASACTTGGSTDPTPKADDTNTESPEVNDGDDEEEGDDVAPVSDGKKILRINNSSEPGSLHPGMATGTHDSWAIDHMFEGLWAKNPDGGDPILAVAKDVTTSEDGLVWTWTLHDDMVWSNGEPVTANDFYYAWSYALDPANDSRYASQIYIFENAEAINAGEMEMDELGVRVIDEYTLEATLNTPMGYLPDYMTHYTFYPVCASNAEANPDWYKTPENFVSNGAFVLTEWKNKESMTLSKNENCYYADQVKLDGLYFTIIDDQTTTWQMYEQGELDLIYPIIASVTEQLRNDNDPELHIWPDLSVYYYYINCDVAPMNNVKVRKALQMGISREDITEFVTKGGQIPAYGLTPPGISDGQGDYQENLGDLFVEDYDEARALLEEGLAEEGMTLADFSPTILYNTDDNHKKIAEAIQDMWKENLGIDVQLENTEFQIVLDRRKAGDFDVCRAGWIGDYSDPMTFLELFTDWSDYNDGNWNNDRYNELIRNAQGSSDNEYRMECMKEAEQILMEEVGVMPIYFYSKPWAIKENIVDYYVPINRYVQLHFADIVE